jgi:hypothetical protein
VLSKMFIGNDESAYVICDNKTVEKVKDNAIQIIYDYEQSWVLDINGVIWDDDIPFSGNFVRMYYNDCRETIFAVDGENTTYMYKNAKFVPIGKDIKHVIKTYQTTVILYEDGRLVENNIRIIANNVSQFNNYECIYYIDNNNTLWDNSNSPLIENIDKIICICGNNYYAIDKNKTLWVCGENHYGQLGLGHSNPITIFEKVMENVEQVECLAFNTFVLDTNGTLWCSDGTFHQVFSNVRLVKYIINTCYIITEDDILYKYGDDVNTEVRFNIISGFANFERIAENVKTLAYCEIEPAKYPKSARNCSD